MLLVEMHAPEHSQLIGNALCRASVVLLVSHFESYLKSLAESFVDSMSEGNLESRQIPLQLRDLHTVPRLAEIAQSKDLVQRAKLLRQLPQTMSLWNDAAKPPKGTLNAQLLARAVTSANWVVIDQLFECMGSTNKICEGDLDIRTSDDEIHSVSIKLSLVDVVQCRNDIAHGDSARKPTVADVTRYVEFLTSMADRLERKTRSLLERALAAS